MVHQAKIRKLLIIIINILILTFICCSFFSVYGSRVLNGVHCLAFSPDGKYCASGQFFGTVKIWDVATKECVTTFKATYAPFYTLSFSPDGKYLAGSGGTSIYIWDFSSRKLKATLDDDMNTVSSISFSPDGKFLASASGRLQYFHEYYVRLWNLETKKCSEIFKDDAGINLVSFSPDGRYLAVANLDNVVKLWEMDSRTLVKTFTIPRDVFTESSKINSIDFRPDGKILAIGTYDGIRLWNIESGEIEAYLETHKNSLQYAAFSPDGTKIAGAYIFHALLWDVTSRTAIKDFYDHLSIVHSVAISPDGKYLATGSEDETVRFWNVETGECIATLDVAHQWP